MRGLVATLIWGLVGGVLAGCSSSAPEPPRAGAAPPTGSPTGSAVVVGRDPGRLPEGAKCPVTREAGRPAEPPAEAVRWGGDAELFGGGGLWVALPHPDLRAARWPGGTYGLKIGWWRGFEGELELRARSLRSGETVTWRAGGGYGPRGFQPSSFGLPRTGCWLVTGILGGTRVNVVLDVRAG